jgi:hypothetical protein
MYTLGINAAFHDTSACLVQDGQVIAAAEEERFTHVKHGKRPVPFTTYILPYHAIHFCLRQAGIPLSQAYLYTDGGIILVAALVFNWEAGLYALITLFIWGVVADYVLEGPGVIRTATIITDRGEFVAGAIIKHLGYGVTAWRGEGKYTHQMHDVLFATINRSQVGELRHVVAAADPDAFLVIGQGHQALGHSFRPLRPRFHSPRVDIALEELTTSDDRRATTDDHALVLPAVSRQPSADGEFHTGHDSDFGSLG